jgi:hypothetical protein
MSVLQHAANLCLRILGNLHAGSDVPVHVVVPWVSGLGPGSRLWPLDGGQGPRCCGYQPGSSIPGGRADGSAEPEAMPTR